MSPVLLVLAVQAHVLTLADAVSTAQAHQPQLRQAHAATAAAAARADEARAPILPQVTGTALYQRATGNFAPRPGAVPRSVTTMGGTAPAGPSPWDTYNYLSFGLTLSQYIWDFGQTTGRWNAARATTEAQAQTERATGLQVVLSVRTAYFSARAQKALVDVARENLANQEKHLTQIQGFVRVGTRPEIDLAQARTDRANARVQLINAENGYETARAQLNQTMGIEGPTDYDVEDSALLPIDGEDQPLGVLVDEAQRARPELLSYERQLRAQELTISSVKGAYGPSLGAAMSVTAAGTSPTPFDPATNDGMVGNWNAQVTATWPLFQGLLTWSQLKEGRANLAVIEAQRDTLRQQVRLEVDQARLSVRAAKEAIGAAGEALVNARERLNLAEGRYQTGIGNAIELGDAQVALTNAAAQEVQAQYNLATARAQLAKALGRK